MLLIRPNETYYSTGAIMASGVGGLLIDGSETVSVAYAVNGIAGLTTGSVVAIDTGGPAALVGMVVLDFVQPGDVVNLLFRIDGTNTDTEPVNYQWAEPAFMVSPFPRDAIPNAKANDPDGLLALNSQGGITLAPTSGVAIGLFPQSGGGIQIQPSNGSQGVSILTTGANAVNIQAIGTGLGLNVSGGSGAANFQAAGAGAFGIRVIGNATAYGIQAIGGLAGASFSGSTNGPGLSVTGSGAGAGFVAVGGATGNGVVFTRGGVNGDDVLLTNSDAPTLSAAVLLDPGEKAGVPVGLPAMIRRTWESSEFGNERDRDRSTGVAELKNAAGSGTLVSVQQSSATVGSVTTDKQTAGA